MADEPDNLVLQLLHRIDAKLDGVIEDVRELNARMARCVERLAAIDLSLGRIDARLEHIDRRIARCFPSS